MFVVLRPCTGRQIRCTPAHTLVRSPTRYIIIHSCWATWAVRITQFQGCITPHLRPHLCSHIQGCLAPITVRIPPACLLNPSETAAVVGGNVLTSQRVTDVVLKAFSAAAASQVRASPLRPCPSARAEPLACFDVMLGRAHLPSPPRPSPSVYRPPPPPLQGCINNLPPPPPLQGCMNNLTFGDEGMGYYETIAGGAGAGPGWHGRSGVHTHMTNTRITDPEILERR